MLKLLEQNRQQIVELCERYGVRRLDLFGSGATGNFDPARSDVDFLVEFVNYAVPSIADDWFGLQEDLTALLGVPVELTSIRTATNPFFLELANRYRVKLYAA